MAKISQVGIALGAGAAGELLLCGLAALFGRFGPCGPASDVTGALLLAHVPGMWLAGHCVPAGSSLDLPVVIGTTAVLLSLATYAALGISGTLTGRLRSRLR